MAKQVQVKWEALWDSRTQGYPCGVMVRRYTNFPLAVDTSLPRMYNTVRFCLSSKNR